MADGLNALANLLGKVNANNALVVTLDGGSASATVFLGGDGTAAAPTFSFTSDATNGMYLSAADTLGWSAGGTLRMSVSTTALTSSVTVVVSAGQTFQMGTTPTITATVPTVTSAGTSPSIAGSQSIAFRVNVGTGGTATTIVLAMPITAATGWNVFAENITACAANRIGQRVVFQSSTTTSVTVQNQTIATGAALAFTASDIVSFLCVAY